MTMHLLDTPVSRRLLALLEETAEAAVERERGSVDRDGDLTVCGETQADMTLRLRMDVEGLAGRD